MKKILVLLLIITFQSQAQTEVFDALLSKHVSEDGFVDYPAMKNDKAKLDSYINYLSETKPPASWSDNKKKAFWINAYNAYTLKLILENYPLKSITKISKKGKSAWKIPFAVVGGETYTLDHIENAILRVEYFDPRIHVGVNCASGSCPKLANFAFTEANIDAKLESLMKFFINDTTRNQLSFKKVQISSIFDWYKQDFTKEGSVVDYINKYAETPVKPNARISYLTYDWSLNEKK
jgi:hypothetical protein